MTQKSNLYNTREFNNLINSLITNNSIKVQEIVLPPNNIAQHNEISIKTSKDVNFQGIPQNVQLHLKNEGYVNNWNSCLTFQIPIEIDFTKFEQMTETDDYGVQSRSIKADIVVLDNFLCLKVSVSTKANTHQATQYVRILQIPPTPAAWLDNVILQKNNKSNTPLNSYYWDIYRKQCVNNQLVDNDFTQYKQDQYAMVNEGQTNMRLPNNLQDIGEGILDQAETQNKEMLLASYSLSLNLEHKIVYNHTVEIPLAYFHPFFQLSGSSPLELLNDELLLTFNFNRQLFSAVYAYDRYKNFTNPINATDYIPQLKYIDSNNEKHMLQQELGITFTGIDNIKLVLYKDRILKNKRIQPDEFEKFYITFRNSDKVQQIDFNKTSNPVLQRIIPKLNSLDIIQLSVYDPVLYTTEGEQQGLDYYLGYSSLFSNQYYMAFKGFQLNSDSYIPYQEKINFYKLQDVNIQDGYVCENLPFITFGNIQIQIDDNNIIPYQYQSLQNIYQNNMSIYDINDNKQGMNNQWTYGNWLRYWNCYLYKFDQSFGNQDELRSASYQGLKTQGGNSNIYFELYNYNQQEPSKIHKISTSSSWYENWYDNKAFVEFIYYYTSLMMISKGDLILVSEDTAEQIIQEHKTIQRPLAEINAAVDSKLRQEELIVEESKAPEVEETKAPEVQEAKAPNEMPPL